MIQGTERQVHGYKNHDDCGHGSVCVFTAVWEPISITVGIMEPDVYTKAMHRLNTIFHKRLAPRALNRSKIATKNSNHSKHAHARKACPSDLSTC